MQLQPAWHDPEGASGPQGPSPAIDARGRRARRYPIQLPVLHAPWTPSPTHPGVAWSRNLSEGGACLELAEPLPPDAPLWLCLRTDCGAIEAEGRVAWSGEGSGQEQGGFLHGVAFTRIAPAETQALWELLVAKGMVRPAGVRLPLEIPVTWEPK